MRIVITMLLYYPDNPSGSSRLAYDEAVFLANLGHEVWVVTQDMERNKPDYSFQDGLHVLRYPSPKLNLFDPRSMRAHQLQTQSLLSSFVRKPIDLIHGHSLFNYDGAIALYRDNVRTCYSLHSPVRLEYLASGRGAPLLERLRLSIRGNFSHYIERRCLRRSDVVTVFSDYSRSLLHDLHGGHILHKSRVIPGWVDLSRFCIASDRQALKSHLGWPTGVPVLFTLRRMVPRMGLDRLLYALGKIRSGGRVFHLVLGGGGPLYSQLKALARELGLLNFVHFLGRVPDNILPQMYAAADAFILPTVELECFGLIALEALACGRPVLATPVGAIPEVVGRIEPRWLARNQSVEAIARLINSYLDGELPSHDPERLRQIVAQTYSSENALRQLVAAATGELQWPAKSNVNYAYRDQCSVLDPWRYAKNTGFLLNLLRALLRIDPVDNHMVFLNKDGARKFLIAAARALSVISFGSSLGPVDPIEDPPEDEINILVRPKAGIKPSSFIFNKVSKPADHIKAPESISVEDILNAVDKLIGQIRFI